MPKPGEAPAWFEKELARIKAHIAEQKLKIVRTPADVDLALKGDPHVVLSVEGASFLDNEHRPAAGAYDLGIRHIQLVHYIRNPIGDFQTEPPEHSGLTDLGKEVVQECNRLGILVDLAHCTDDAVSAGAGRLQGADGVVAQLRDAHAQAAPGPCRSWQARQLSAGRRQGDRAKGGVVGLWALRSDVGPTLEAYADRLTEMADWLGEDHVAFGTDMNAISQSGDQRATPTCSGVVDHWQTRGHAERAHPQARHRELRPRPQTGAGRPPGVSVGSAGWADGDAGGGHVLLGLADGVGAEVEDRGGEHGAGVALASRRRPGDRACRRRLRR